MLADMLAEECLRFTGISRAVFCVSLSLERSLLVKIKYLSVLYFYSSCAPNRVKRHAELQRCDMWTRFFPSACGRDLGSIARIEDVVIKDKDTSLHCRTTTSQNSSLGTIVSHKWSGQNDDPKR